MQRARDSAIADTKVNQARIMHVYREMQSELHDLEEEYGSIWYLRNENPFDESKDY